MMEFAIILFEVFYYFYKAAHISSYFTIVEFTDSGIRQVTTDVATTIVYTENYNFNKQLRPESQYYHPTQGYAAPLVTVGRNGHLANSKKTNPVVALLRNGKRKSKSYINLIYKFNQV